MKNQYLVDSIVYRFKCANYKLSFNMCFKKFTSNICYNVKIFKTQSFFLNTKSSFLLNFFKDFKIFTLCPVLKVFVLGFLTTYYRVKTIFIY